MPRDMQSQYLTSARVLSGPAGLSHLLYIFTHCGTSFHFQAFGILFWKLLLGNGQETGVRWLDGYLLARVPGALRREKKTAHPGGVGVRDRERECVEPPWLVFKREKKQHFAGKSY